MTWTDLGNPIPREQPLIYQQVEWPIGEILSLPPPISHFLPPVNVVIDSRRTKRDFGFVDLHVLSEWLWLVARELITGHSKFGFPLTLRPTPSAGAIHPIHIILSLPKRDGWWIYLPDRHELALLNFPNQTCEQIYYEILPIIDAQSGIVIRLIAEPGKTSAKYKYSDSLVWRDAGVLIGQMAIVAEALTYNFCPLGITGEEWCKKLELKGRLVGVGLAILGSR